MSGRNLAGIVQDLAAGYPAADVEATPAEQNRERGDEGVYVYDRS